MNKPNYKEIVENLIDTFLDAGEISLKLREKGLTKMWAWLWMVKWGDWRQYCTAW